MNQLGTEKTMTVKEVAEILKCSEDTILRACNKLFPGHIKNGIKTLLTEVHTTAIKLDIESHHNLLNTEELEKTDLEKELIIQQTTL